MQYLVVVSSELIINFNFNLNFKILKRNNFKLKSFNCTHFYYSHFIKISEIILESVVRKCQTFYGKPLYKHFPNKSMKLTKKKKKEREPRNKIQYLVHI